MCIEIDFGSKRFIGSDNMVNRSWLRVVRSALILRRNGRNADEKYIC